MPPKGRYTVLWAWIFAAALGAVAARAADAPPAYELDAEVAVRGVVEQVLQHAGWMGWDGVYGSLRTSQGQIVETHFAPAAFLKMLDILPARGDAIEVKGVFVETASGKVLLVRELRRANVVVNLRDARGNPVW